MPSRDSASLRTAARPLSAALALTLLVSACSLKTAPAREAMAKETLPNMKLRVHWVEPAPAGAVQDNWVAALGDPQLPALVAEAIKYNADLRIALTRVEQA